MVGVRRRAVVVAVAAWAALAAPALARADYLDRQNTYSNTTVGVADGVFGQSWTAGVTGNLTRITTPITCTGGGSSSTLSIYTGAQSVYGPALPPPLYTQAVTLSTPGCGTLTPTPQNLVLSTPVPILAGTAYTFLLTGQGTTSTIMSNIDVYPGGAAYFYPSYDLVFATYTDTAPSDTTPPTVQITNPPGGTDLHGTVPLAAAASDNVAVDHVTYEYFDGTAFHAIGSSSTAPNYPVSFDTTAYPDVAHDSATVYATAYDTSGNASSRSGAGVGIDNTPPTAALTAPNDGAVVSGTLVFGGDANDAPAGVASGVAAWSFDYSPHGTGSWSVAGGASGTGSGAISGAWDTTGVAGGAYDVSLEVVDNAGNVTRSAVRTITVDNSNPDGVLKIDSPNIASLDPLNATVGPAGLQAGYATCAKLINEPDVAGRAGLENLTPELAAGPPTVSADRTTYTFTLRTGVKFSDGSDVTPQAIVHELERVLAPANIGNYTGGIFGDIAGAAAYSAGDAMSISGLSVDGNTLTIQLTHPDEALLAKLSSPQACAVPPSTPIAEQPAGLPSAGPYYVASFVPGKQLILDRNPHYTGPRPHNFDRFVYTLGVSPATAEDDVKRNVADYAAGAWNALPLADLAPLSDGAYASRLFRAPTLGLRYVVYNTARSAFALPGVRNAVSGVLDRSTYVADLPHASSVTDQLLPPGSPGFTDWSIYPSFVTDDTAAATYIRNAGATPSTINLYAQTGTQWDNLVTALSNRLTHLGFTVNVVRESPGVFFSAGPGGILNPTTPDDVALIGWLADYPDPNDFLNALLDPSFGNDWSHFSDPTELAHMQSVDAIPPGPSRWDAYAKLDLQLSRDYAPMTAYGTFDSVDFFSARVGCQTFNPWLGMDLAALCTIGRVSISLTSDTTSTPPGRTFDVPVASIPVSALRGVETSTTQAAPLDTIPLDTIPLDTIPLDTIPLDTIPLDTIGIDAALLRNTSLGTIPLDTIPLPGGETWEGLLSGTLLGGVPVNTLSLLDVATSAPAVLHALHLSDLASSPLDTIPLAAVTLTTAPLDTIPIEGHTDTATNEADWCSLIHAIPGFAGFDCTNIGSQTVLGLSLRGVPLDTIPLDTIPLDTIDLRGTPLDTIPLDTIGIDTIRSSPLDTIPLDTIDFSISPLDTIPLDTIAANVVDCNAYPCDHSHTLGGAAAANALKPGATFGQVGAYPGVTLGNVGRGLPPTVTLHDLLALLLGQSSYDWDKLPLTFPLADYEAGGAKIGYTATFEVDSSAATATPVIVVQLTGGARYVVGSTSVAGSTADPSVTESGGDETLTWKPTAPTNAPQTLTFQTRPGLDLGSDTASASIAVGAAAGSAPAPVSVAVGDTFESNDTAATAQPAPVNTLQLSYITSASDKDFFTMPVPAAGVETKIFLSHLPADYDLIVYGPTQQALRAAPLDTIPLDTIAPQDPSPTLQQQSQSLSPESLQDVPVDPPAGQSLLGVSDVRGTGDEEVDLVSTGGGGNYTIEVVGYNGAFGGQPYMLRSEQEQPRALPACQPRTMGSGGTAGTMPSIPGNVDTLFLMNEKQFGDLNGAAGETQVVNSLNSLINTANVGFVGAVVPVEAISQDVRNAYTAWNQNPCDPSLANNVVRAIIAGVDGIRSTHAGIKNIVLVGGDDEIPMARLADPTPLSNEANYASTFGFSSNNEFVSAFANHDLMSDDPYGDVHGTTYPGGQLYLPDEALGRLVDTPGEIAAQLSQFAAAKGQLALSTELTTGYSFLWDGAVQEAAALLAPGRTTQGDLLSPPGSPNQWTLSQLTAAMFPASGTPPQIMALNAHYNQRQLLPADQSAAQRTDELYTTAMLAAQGPSAVRNRLVLTLGCHSGVNAPDTLFSSTAAQDWAQTYVGHGAIGFIGNTGYGLGDDVTVAYSESLHVDLAKRLNGSLPVGQALMYAKQDYLASLAQVSAYDAKVMNEATLYGLPMWRIGSGTPPAPPSPGPTFTDPSTGGPAQSVSFAPTFTRNDTTYGTYFAVNGESVAESRRPIEPSSSADVTEPNLIAHGYLITSLASTDQAIDAAFSRPVNDSPTAEPELVGLVDYPTKLQAIRTIQTPNGQRQRLVLTLGQYESDGIPDAQGTGTQRLFSSAGGRVLYAAPSAADFTPPSFGPVTVDRVTLGDGSTDVAFTAPVTDGGGDANVKRVLVLYLDGTTWRSLDLSRSGNVWSGAGPIGGETGVSYFAQAVDGSGNVGVVSDKGSLAPIVAPRQSGGVTVSLSGSPTNGWYTSAVDATFSAGSGVTVESSLDGSMFQPVTGPVHVDGTGVHTLRYDASDGSSGVVVVPIDETPPTISIGLRSYVIGSTGNRFDFVCGDAGSGVATCTSSPAQPDTSSAGVKQFTVTATDRVGNTTQSTGSYQVVWPFTGFFSPVSNLPRLNVVNAGQAVPVKFSLSGNRGLDILAAGYPQSTGIACDSLAPLTTSVSTATAGSSSLSYDSTTDTYSYTWKTDKSWSGTCRQLDVGLIDGSHHVADFEFR